MIYYILMMLKNNDSILYCVSIIIIIIITVIDKNRFVVKSRYFVGIPSKCSVCISYYNIFLYRNVYEKSANLDKTSGAPSL